MTGILVLKTYRGDAQSSSQCLKLTRGAFLTCGTILTMICQQKLYNNLSHLSYFFCVCFTFIPDIGGVEQAGTSPIPSTSTIQSLQAP